MKEFIVKKKIVLNAAPSVVWDALTDPRKTKKYFFNCEVHSDWKMGSPISFKGRIFLLFKVEMNGQITKIEPGKLLQYNLKNRKKGKDVSSISKVTDELSYKDGKTTLSITDDVGKGPGAEKRYHRSEKGWNKILKGLKRLVEAQE
jgi:uncharacterized protein YndB with AHSA1/START domain